VSEISELPTIEPDDFARRYSLRASKLMWFLGAGASAAAGIPTAGDMVWEFKQRLYITQRGASPSSVADLSNPLVRSMLQGHIDGSGRFPPAGAPDEYASLFEAVWSAERDRQTYIDSKIKGGKPSYGHVALATFMQADKARLVWTTNFDPLVADACAKVYGGTGQLTTATPDAPDLAKNALQAERWPIEIKLHGDFRSRRLKNTTDELRHQDEYLRQTFVESGCRYGLIIVGYSGRDDSVMDAFESVLKSGTPFPGGLFWLHRGEVSPLPRVYEFLKRAAVKLGAEAGLVRIENFDEALRDLVRAISGLNTTVLDAIAADRRWRTPAPVPRGKKGWPVVRLNALQTETPTVCRRVVCQVGGTREVRAAVTTAGVDVLVARRRGAVLAFGSDADVKAAFSPHTITDFDLHTIEVRRLRYDSAERGLLRDALTRAIARARGLRSKHARTSDSLVPEDLQAATWAPLKKIIGGPLRGNVPGIVDLNWSEGVAIRLDWADDRQWLVFEPRIVFEGKTKENAGAAADFGRERTVKRYNRQLNDLFGFWAGVLAGDGQPINALGIADGVDASFRISSDTAYSRRAIP
jgi:SIR2-like domain